MTDLQVQAIMDAFVKAVDDLTKAASAATKQATTQKDSTPKAATQPAATSAKVQQNDLAKMSPKEVAFRLNPTKDTADAYMQPLYDAAKKKQTGSGNVDDPTLLESAKALLASAKASLDAKAVTQPATDTQPTAGTQPTNPLEEDEKPKLDRQGREQEAIAYDHPVDAFKLGVEDSRLKLAKNSADMMLDIGQQLGSQLTDGLTTAWDAFISGSKSAGEAMANFARSTLSWLTQIITKYAMMKLVQSALNGISSFFGDGGSVAAGTTAGNAADFSAAAQGLTFAATGGPIRGWSPSATADNIPAMLTAREFVQPVRAVDHYGLRFMEAVRRLQFPRHIAHALAGGTIPAVPSGFRLAQGGMAAAALQTTVKAGDTKLKVVNVLHSNMMGDYMKSADGETVLLNMIRRNGSAIRTIIG